MEPLITKYIREVLGQLQAGGFPEALVAGGCLRDLDNGRDQSIKDVDVFITDRPMYLIDLLLALPGFDYRLAVPMHVAQYMEFEGVVAVHEFTAEGYPPLQVVVMKKPVEIRSTIERHDFGICQVGYDGYRVHMTEAYHRDKLNHTFTVIRCRNEKDLIRSMRRWARLSEKYPDWNLVYDEALIRH